jgi:hypothetical protein
VATTLFKKVDYSVSKLIAEIDSGEIALPEIQRPFVWKKSKVRDLFDSMYSGFPVGYLLLWSSTNGSSPRHIGTDGKQSAPRLLIIDGQQRLTSLYSVIKGRAVLDKNFGEDRIQISFRPRDGHFSVADAATRNDPEFISDITDLWAGTPGHFAFIRDFLKRLREVREVSDEEEAELAANIDRVYDVQNYPFTALELAPEIEAERVAEVFVRINSKGVALNQADFILTLMSVYWEDGRRALERFSEASRIPTTAPSSFNHFIMPDPDQMLRVGVGLAFRRGKLRDVYRILRGRELDSDESREETRDAQFDKLRAAQAAVLDITSWHEFLKSLIRAGFRGKNMITSETALLYSYLLFLIGKHDCGVKPHSLREVMARWFFMAQLTGRYTGSPETIIETDLGRLRGVKTADDFVERLDGMIASALTADFWSITIPNNLAISVPRSPALYAYYAALNLLGARVLFSKLRVSELFDPALRSKKSPLERHHLFPKAYLKKLGVTETREINQLANYALVEWPDNIEISDSPPSDYFPLLAERCNAGELRDMCSWHALPPDWHQMEYQAFLEARRSLMADIIKKGYERLKGGDETHTEAEVKKEELATTLELIATGEGAYVEFKASARFSQHTKTRDVRIEENIVKTIAGFANAGGGTLLIGVNDEGAVVGLENDYSLLGKPNRDGFELWLRDTLETYLGKVATTDLAVSFESLDGAEVCRVDVTPADAPVFARPPKGNKAVDFYIRLGNSTRRLGPDELLEYKEQHWDSP